MSDINYYYRVNTLEGVKILTLESKFKYECDTGEIELAISIFKLDFNYCLCETI